VFAGVGLQSHEQDAKQSVLWIGPMQVIEAPKVQPSAFHSMLCDESELQSDSDDEAPQDAEASAQAGPGEVCCRLDAVPEVLFAQYVAPAATLSNLG
jgi:hypothetical protein